MLDAARATYSFLNDSPRNWILDKLKRRNCCKLGFGHATIRAVDLLGDPHDGDRHRTRRQPV
ncbi:MAG: hypothetical protein J0626_00430, partial [Rhodospirillaceae bacterium]|nr:hypothetical protein [Rhodospirillaceae bacterium]